MPFYLVSLLISLIHHLYRRGGRGIYSLPKPALDPTPIHLDFLPPIHDQPSIDIEIENLKARACFHLPLLSLSSSSSSSSFFMVTTTTTTPKPSQLVALKEINPRPVAPHVEILLHPPPLPEAHLSQIAPAVVAEEDLPPGPEEGVDVGDGLAPLGGGQGGEDEDEEDDVDASFC